MNVRLEDAIVINYMVAAALSIAMAGPEHAVERLSAPSSLAGAAMGVIFLYMFRKIGECTQQLGLGVVSRPFAVGTLSSACVCDTPTVAALA